MDPVPLGCMKAPVLVPGVEGVVPEALGSTPMLSSLATWEEPL